MDKKSFFEKAKVSAERIADYTDKAAAQAAGKVSKKSSSAVQAAKLKMQMFDLNTEIEILYKEIGKMVYDVHTGQEGDQEALETKLSLLDEKLEKLTELKEKSHAVKEEVLCPVCGEKCGMQDAFCKKCGAQL